MFPAKAHPSLVFIFTPCPFLDIIKLIGFGLSKVNCVVLIRGLNFVRHESILVTAGEVDFILH